MDDVKELAKEFVELIEERDFIVEFNETYNDRCIEIDDVLIPAIIKQIPQGTMNEFNELINSILGEN
jgi:hypothetical protein